MGQYTYVIKYCEKCGYTASYPSHNSSICKRCNIELKVLPEDIKYKYHIYEGAEDWSQLVMNNDNEMIIRLENFAMNELKGNPIFSMDEYNKQIQKEKDDLQELREIDKRRANYISNLPKCPICNSTELDKISFGSRVIKTAFFGLAGAVDDSGKTYKCKNCGSKF